MNKETYFKFIKPAAISVLEEMEMNHVFSAGEFKDLVAKKCERAKRSHIASIIRPLWDYRLSEDKKCAFICIEPSKSLYKKISLEEWKPMEKEFLDSKFAYQIHKAIQLLKDNGYKVERA